MPSESSSSPSNNKALPVVVPLTGAYISQLFLVPGIIVTAAVLILLGFSWLVGGARTPKEFLKSLDSTNADVRWRAANDLAQVLKRDEKLAANAPFALDVAERLRQALNDAVRAEEDVLRRSPRLSPTEEREHLRAYRN